MLHNSSQLEEKSAAEEEGVFKIGTSGKNKCELAGELQDEEGIKDVQRKSKNTVPQ